MRECHMITSALYVDDLSTQFSLLGAAAVTVLDAGDQPLYEPKPNEEPLWDDIHLVAIFEDSEITPQLEAFLHKLQDQHLIKSFQLKDVEEQNWVRKSLDLFVPTPFGHKLWICPSWHVPPNPTATNVMFDPGLAFGTGSHPTTALCLEWLDEHIAGNETIVDYGCGSGILAIAALKLGAVHAIAVDYDTQALDATRANAALNDIASTELEVYLPAEVRPYQADIVIANIISKPLIELAPNLTELTKPDGLLVLSGILSEQVGDVLNAYQANFRLMEQITKENWVRLTLKKT